MNLGIIGAMELEVETLRQSLSQRQDSVWAGMTFSQGQLQQLPVVVVRCGVGKVSAAICVQLLRDKFGVTHVVNTGVAGALDPTLEIGDMVVSQDAIYHDVDCRPVGYALGQVPGLAVQAFPADETLRRLAISASQRVHPGHTRLGRVASGDQFIGSDSQKQRILAHTGAMCAEMEGAAIAQAAYLNHIPYVILRAISDKADHSAQVDYPVFERQAARQCAAVVLQLARQLAP